MAVVPLPLPPNVIARALLHHLLEHGDIVGRNAPASSTPDVLTTLEREAELEQFHVR
jgi:hypothetical protein